MDVWFAIPTCNITRANECFEKWGRQGYKTAALVNGMPRDMASQVKAERIWYLEKYPGWPTSVNILCKQLAEHADIVVSGGDDMDPDPNRNAVSIAHDFMDHFKDAFGVMQPTGDEMEETPRICGSPWMGWKWIAEAYGGRGPMWGEYHHFYADEELKSVSEKLGVLWQRKDLAHRHNHWSRPGGPPKTDYQLVLDQAWSRDGMLNKMRKKNDYPLHQRLEVIE